ncbi:MAG: NAD-dependent epimerase/dehydratase family protein [Rhodothermales bacterium]
MKGRTILLTGGAGFIGTALARELVKDNRVIVFDNGHRGSLAADLSDHPSVIWRRGDVLDAAAVEEAMQGVNAVIHLASIAGVDTVLEMPVRTMEVALIGTYNVLKAAQKKGDLERVIDFSTSEVFGQYAYKVREGEATSLGAVGEARWTYAVSKLASEHLASNYHKQYGMKTVSVRPFNIYGPGQVGEGAIHHFVRRAIADEPLIVHNDGSQIRAWCYIDDIVDAIMLCLDRDEAVGQVFNIGNARSTLTIYDLAQRIIRLSGSGSEIRFEERDGSDVEIRIPSIDKAVDLLGYQPVVDLEEGLERTIAWYRDQQAIEQDIEQDIEQAIEQDIEQDIERAQVIDRDGNLRHSRAAA